MSSSPTPLILTSVSALVECWRHLPMNLALAAISIPVGTARSVSPITRVAALHSPLLFCPTVSHCPSGVNAGNLTEEEGRCCSKFYYFCFFWLLFICCLMYCGLPVSSQIECMHIFAGIVCFWTSLKQSSVTNHV